VFGELRSTGPRDAESGRSLNAAAPAPLTIARPGSRRSLALALLGLATTHVSPGPPGESVFFVGARSVTLRIVTHDLF
jgi:hypothetical protein